MARRKRIDQTSSEIEVDLGSQRNGRHDPKTLNGVHKIPQAFVGVSVLLSFLAGAGLGLFLV